MSVSQPAEGHDDTKCGHKTRSGAPCGLPKGWGTDHPGIGYCKFGLGSTEMQRRSAARQMVDRDARRMLTKWGEPVPLVDPVRRLQVLAGEADRWLMVCREQVDGLEELTTWAPMEGEVVRAVVRQYTEAMERVHKMSADLVRLGLEERAQRLDEAELVVLAGLFDRALGVVPAEFRDGARRVLEVGLRELERGEGK